MPRAPRTPSAASPARSRRCGSRTPRECGRDIVGSYTHRPFRLSCLRYPQSSIFNQLCTAYRRSAQDPDFGLRAYDVMVELAYL